MTWVNLFGANLTQGWLFSAPVDGEWFRVNARLTGNTAPPYKFWGYIGQARSVATANPDFFAVRRLYPFDNRQVIRFVSPPIWGNDRAIALKGINPRYYAIGFSWFVRVEVWTGELPPDGQLQSAPPGFIPGVL